MTERQQTRLPLLPLRDMCAMPHALVQFDIARKRTRAGLSRALENNGMAIICMQKDPLAENPKKEDLEAMGTAIHIRQCMPLGGEGSRVLAEVICRARIDACTEADGYYLAEAELLPDEEAELALETEARMRIVTKMLEEFAQENDKVAPQAVLAARHTREAGRFCDLVAEQVLVHAQDKQAVLNTLDTEARLELLCTLFTRERDIMRLEKRIRSNTQAAIEKRQKEYYLREQLRTIHEELGDGEAAEMDEYRKKIDALPLSEETRAAAKRELERLPSIGSMSPESGVIRTYLDTLLEMPWGVYAKDNSDIARARKILDRDHYGLEKVKERILEYIAVRRLTETPHGPILCLVGPPGVGKTSIAQSLARATGRPYVRAALGGVRDEAEIRGHRRTYIGAMCGTIASRLKLAGCMNPVFLLDELDKLSHDRQGDPAAALLEVLDAEQNSRFRDHYLDVELDLSRVLFIATANSAADIPPALHDRLEIITLEGYTEEEKCRIARKYLLPKQIDANGLSRGAVKLTDGALKEIIRAYTREAGVRTLERRIAALCRKAAVKAVEDGAAELKVQKKDLFDLLGPAVRRGGEQEKEAAVGRAVGLAWTAAGGELLPVEASVLTGKGRLELTGHLGDVMKESAQAAFSFVRSQAEELGLSAWEKKDVHVHVPAGAVPKDGPSAGITMAAAIASALSGRRLRNDIAMTGEITLRGRVMPIGGVRDKVLAAHRAGMRAVILPEENRADAALLPEDVREALPMYFVRRFDEVWELLQEGSHA